MYNLYESFEKIKFKDWIILRFNMKFWIEENKAHTSVVHENLNASQWNFYGLSKATRTKDYFRKLFFLHSHHGWEGIGFMWKMTFEIFIKSLRFETPWVRKNGFYETVCL